VSFRAYLLAIRDDFRAPNPNGLGLKTADCDVTPGGKPPPRAGKMFVSIHAGSRSQGSDTHCHREYAAHITLSLRIDMPFDRIGSDVLEQAQMGLDDRADAIIARMQNQQWELMAAANTKIDQAVGELVANGFLEPLRYRSDNGEPVIMDGSWYQGDPDELSAAVLTIQFGGAKRLQLLGSVR